MSHKTWNPLRLDVPAFAREMAQIDGVWPAHELPRFAQAGAPEAPAHDWADVKWQLKGEQRAAQGGASEVWLHLSLQANVHPTCQRCLQPVMLPVTLSRWFRFVSDEAQAAELDADSEHDVLVWSRAFDTKEWMEDELLLELPIVPLHDVCPDPLPMPAAEFEEVVEMEERPHPFALLQTLKSKGGGKA
jgi:uncharacterized protein